MKILRLFLALLILVATTLRAQVPHLVSYQGRIVVDKVNFDGPGSFKFALVSPDLSRTYWSNDGTSSAGSQPTVAVPLTVTNGLYSVLLGDTSLSNMAAIPAGVWEAGDVRLRVWFNDGRNGFQLLSPDQRVAPSSYLSDESVNTAAIAANAVTAAKIANGAVSAAKLASGAVTAASIAPGSIGGPHLATGALAKSVTVAGATQAAAVSTAYTATNPGLTNFTLPATAQPGDTVRITGLGAGGWVANGSWKVRSAPSLVWRNVTCSADGRMMFATAGNGGIYRSMDGGITWTQSVTGAGDFRKVATSADGSRVLASLNGGVPMISSDYGKTFIAVDFDLNGDTSDLVSDAWNAVACSADFTRLMISTVGGNVRGSRNSGMTWSPVGIKGFNPGLAPPDVFALASSADGAFTAAATDHGILTMSSNGALQTLSNPTVANWQSVAMSANGARLVACVNGGQIFTSSDSGASWSNANDAGTANWTWVACSADGNCMAAAMAIGRIYLSRDAGATWVLQTDVPLASWSSVALAADGHRGVAVATTGQVYTYSALNGPQGSVTTLTYLGNGEWGTAGSPKEYAGQFTGNFIGDGSKLTNLPTANNYLSAYCSILSGDFTIWNQPVRFDHITHASGWDVSNGLKPLADGVYLIQYSATAVQNNTSTTGDPEFTFRVEVNSVPVEASRSATYVLATDQPNTTGSSCIVTLRAGDTVSFHATTTNSPKTQLGLESPLLPGVSLTIVRLR